MTIHTADSAPNKRMAPTTAPMPMPAFTPSLRPRVGGGTVEVCSGSRDVAVLVLPVEVEVAVTESDCRVVVELAAGSAVGKCPACHSMSPPYVVGRSATAGMTGGAEKAT
jgi:hypothetical protein